MYYVYPQQKMYEILLGDQDFGKKWSIEMPSRICLELVEEQENKNINISKNLRPLGNYII